MYKILGADQKEYGPVTAEQINQWIKEGRVDGSTRTQAEGSAEWKPLSSFPEFANALFAKAGLPGPPPPPPPPGNPDALVNEITARDYALDVSYCLSRGWKLVMEHFWLLVGASFVIGLVEGAIPLIWGPLHGGLFFLFLKLIRKEKAEFSDAFIGFNRGFLPLFLAGLVIWALTAVGYVFCVLPGIYLTVAWLFAFPLIIDKGLDFWPAMEVSRRVVHKHWWTLFGLLLLNILVCLLGLLVCCIGVYVAMPVTLGALAYAYEDIFGAPSSPPAQPR